MTTPKQLQDSMRFFHQTAVEMYRQDGTHGTMLFPYRDGDLLNVLGLGDVELNDPALAETAAARIRVSVLPEAPDAFILISEALVVLSAKVEALPPGEHPERKPALIIGGATSEGFRWTSVVVFDEQRNVVSYLTSDNPMVVMLSSGMLDALAGPIFDADADRWRRALDQRSPGWRDQQQVLPVMAPADE